MINDSHPKGQRITEAITYENFRAELETADIIEWNRLCIVCGKSLDQGDGICHIKVDARMDLR